jgi:hypothetical protein
MANLRGTCLTWAVALLALLLLFGCTKGQSVPTPSPKAWPWTEILLGEQVEACQAPPLAAPPNLGPVIAYGLEGEHWWRPDTAYKVNWMTTGGTDTTVDLTANRQGESSPTYRVAIPAMPSIIQFPGPGCWEVRAKVAGHETQLLVPIKPDRPIYLSTQESGPRLTDRETIRQLLNSATSSPDVARPGRPAALLIIHWQSGGQSPIWYYPATKEQPATIVLNKQLLTADCRDGQTLVVRQIPGTLAAKLEAELRPQAAPAQNDEALLNSGACYALRP